jgi:tetraacyldisaccharide 4'-kinase
MDEAALHELMSGRRRDQGARLLRGGLGIASLGYSAVMRLRNLAYDGGWLHTSRADVPVISVGNITTGGTGKTPLTAWLATWLVAAGRQPGLLSRGYRSLDSRETSPDSTLPPGRPTGNDEKLVLDRLCPGVPHLQQRDRVASARRAVQEFDCDVLLLDDGLQHRRLHRDLDLLLVDALQPWGYGHVLPRGLLREPIAGLRRADLVLITRANQCSAEQRAALREDLRRIRGSDECAEVAFTPQRLVDVNWRPESLISLSGKKTFAFCGIGNPAGFRKTIAELGVSCDTMQTFADHHHYEAHDLTALAQTARSADAEVVLTTQKDLVKISPGDWHGPPLYAVEIGVEFLSGQDLLESRLQQAIIPRVRDQP